MNLLRTFLLLLTGLLAMISPKAQPQNIVLLVDVSGSIPHTARNEAREMIKNVLTGRNFSQSSFYYERDPKSTMNISTPMASNGSHILLMRFGNKETSDDYADLVIRNYPTDLMDFIDAHFPTASEYKDQFTYLTLGKAKAAQRAKQLGMSKFMLLLVSDNINDFTGGSSPNYNQYEQQLVDNYNSMSNPVWEDAIQGYVRLKGNNDYKIPLRNVDVSLVKVVPSPNPGPVPPPDSAAAPLSIEFAGPLATATHKQPAVVKSEAVNISWLCKNCPDNTLYNVIVSQTEGGKFRDAKSKNISVPSVTKKLESGVYKITVSGTIPNSEVQVAGAVTYVSVDSGTGTWWLWIIVILAVIGGAIYWNKDRQKKKIREVTKGSPSILDDRGAGGGNYRREEF